MHKNVLAFIFLPSTAPRRAAPPPALPFLRRPGKLHPAAPAPALPCPPPSPRPGPHFCPILFFLTPLYFFRPTQGEVKKGPHTYPTFALSNPQSKMYARAVPTAHGRARVRTGAFSNYRAGGIVRGRLVTAQAARVGVPLVIVGAAACRAAALAAGVPPGAVCLGVGGVLAGGVCGWCWWGGGVVLAGELLPCAAGGWRSAGWWCGVNSGKKKSPCRR